MPLNQWSGDFVGLEKFTPEISGQAERGIAGFNEATEPWSALPLKFTMIMMHDVYD